MQGINRAYIYHATEADYTTPEYLTDLKTALEKAFVGWNLTCEIDDNNLIVLRGDTIIFKYYNDSQNRIYIDFYFNDNTQLHTLETEFYIHEVIYSSRFIALQMRFRQGIDIKTTPIFITKSSNNNIVTIFPSSTTSMGTDTNRNSLNTAYYNNSSVCRSCVAISKDSISCPEPSMGGGTSINNASNIVYNSIISYPLVTNHINNIQKLTMTPLIVSSTSEIEYASYAYYIVTNSFSLHPNINAILKIGNDYYFTNGIVAIKLT